MQQVITLIERIERNQEDTRQAVLELQNIIIDFQKTALDKEDEFQEDEP